MDSVLIPFYVELNALLHLLTFVDCYVEAFPNRLARTLFTVQWHWQ